MKMMKPITNEQMFLQLGDEFAELVITQNIILIEAVSVEDFELAAKTRDYINQIITTSASISTPFIDLTEERLIDHYKEQNEYVYSKMKEKYENK